MSKILKSTAILMVFAVIILCFSSSQKLLIRDESPDSSTVSTSSPAPAKTYTSDELGLYIKSDSKNSFFVLDKTGSVVSGYQVDGLLNIRKDGEIIIKSGDAEEFILPHTILFNDVTIDASVGETFAPKVSFFPENTSCEEYTVSVVSGEHTFDSNGNVVFTSSGEAEIKITSVSNPSISDICSVKIYPADEKPQPPTPSTKEYGSKTIGSVMGFDGETYLSWLYSHEGNTYYLTTPYKGKDYRSPNGDTSFNGFPAMSCTGFVWHVLYSAVKEADSQYTDIPAYGGWVGYYRKNDIKRYRFETKDDMLSSGMISKGDIIWIFDKNGENKRSGTHHIGIYWGDGASDVWWHSLDGTRVGMASNANMISHIGSLVAPYYYVVLDVA